jgi:hypothetical protein
MKRDASHVAPFILLSHLYLLHFRAIVIGLAGLTRVERVREMFGEKVYEEERHEMLR